MLRVWAKPLAALAAVCALSWTVASPAGVAPVDERALAARVVTVPTITAEPVATTTTPPPAPTTTATTGAPPTTAPPTTRATAAAPKPPPSTAPPVAVRAPVSTLRVTLPPVTPPPPRDLSVYKGLGTWVDAYDFSPEYQPNGAPPAVTPESVDQMVGQGVRTLYLQAAKDDTRSPGELVNPEILGPMLARAHSHGIKVVAWYLPKFYDLDSDMRRLLAMRDFRYDGEGFDGLGLDIEWREDVPNNAERNSRLIELSRRLRRAMGDAAVSAIPLPPVLTEVINPAYWPDFPWRELAPLYDVWMPMGYWTFRTRSSGYKDGYRYTVENIRRLRADLGLPAAAVHPVGGTDNKSTDEDYRGFVRACAEQHAMGGSIYDWLTTPPQAWGILRAVPD
jgi:hypothetical protein